MGIINRLFNAGTGSDETRSFEFGDLLSPRTAGVSVTETTALNYVTVFACVRLLSESVASLPVDVFRKQNKQRTEVAAPSWLETPNVEMTLFEVVERSMASLCLWGNAYLLTTRNAQGSVVELWPLDPSRVSVDRDTASNDLVYLVDGERLTRSQVLHIKAFTSPSSLQGLSPIAVGRSAIAAGIATDNFANTFWSNGARPNGILHVPESNGTDDNDYAKRLLAGWNQNHSGAGNGNKTALLLGGITYEAISVPAEDAQFLGTRKYQVEEIARLYRVPPHMVQDLSRSTFNNIEHSSIDFVVHSLRPWLVRLEAAFSGLLPTGQYVKFNEGALLRGDAQSQAESLKIAWEHAIISSNEWRQKLDMEPIADGDAFYAPLNFAEVGAQREPTLAEKAQAVAALVQAGMDIGEAKRLVGLTSS